MNIPILMLSAKSEDMNKIQGIMNGSKVIHTVWWGSL